MIFKSLEFKVEPKPAFYENQLPPSKLKKVRPPIPSSPKHCSMENRSLV